MRIQIDTGHRLDKSGDTTFAFTNDTERVILLKQAVRDECLKQLGIKRKVEGQVRLLTACIYLLIQDHLPNITHITIDREYPGHEETISDLIYHLLKRHLSQPELKIGIEFRAVGKQSRVHEIAWKTYRKERQPDKVLTTTEILSVLLP